MRFAFIDRLHVSASQRDVLRACWKKLRKSARKPERRGERRKFYAAACRQHRENGNLYSFVMRGC
jgi:hypothetical protein